MSRKETLNKTRLAHQGQDRSLEFAKAIDMSLPNWLLATRLFRDISEDEGWDNRRSPHSLKIDCIYLIAKKNDKKISRTKFVKLTKEMFGVSTQPRPNDWKPQFKELVEGYLDEVITT